MSDYPMNRAPRCAAKSKRSGIRCKAPALKGKRVCRMHGGRSPGAPTGQAHGNYVHGLRTAAAKAERREMRELLRTVRELIAAL